MSCCHISDDADDDENRDESFAPFVLQRLMVYMTNAFQSYAKKVVGECDWMSFMDASAASVIAAERGEANSGLC